MQSLDEYDFNEALPALSTFQLHNRNNAANPLSSSLAGRCVTVEDELPAQHISTYCNNVRGWYRYDSLNRECDRLANSSPNVQNISR